MSANVLPHNVALSKRWGSPGDRYEAFSEHFADAIERCVERASVTSNDRALDIATGTGWAARLLAQKGAKVTGIDFAEELISAAKRQSASAGVEIEFQVGDAEALPCDDATFDVVVSSFGVIFAGDHARAASEIGRVCKPGGRLSMTAWAKDGWLERMNQDVFWKYIPKPRNPTTLWGDPEYARSLLGEAFEFHCEKAITTLRAPSALAVWDLFRQSQPTTVSILAGSSPERQMSFEADFVRFHEQFERDGQIEMPREYWLYSGTRR
jgi:ubiquinone/menaquinone biosynthesis C-methylase UbiE